MADGVLSRLRIDPFLLALFTAVVLASIWPPRGTLATVFGFLANAGIVLIFFLHGAKLSREAIVAGLTHWRLHLLILALTFLVFPAFGMALATLSWLDPALANGVRFLTLVPSTIQSSIAFTAIAGGNVAAAVCAAAFSNLAGVFVTPALSAALIGAEGGAQLSGGAVARIFGQLLVPFLIGQLMRPLIGEWVSDHKRLVSVADRGSIVLIAYAAFAAAVVDGLWARAGLLELLLVAAICIVLVAIMLVVSMTAARLLGFAREDRIVIQFAGAKKSLAAGIAMAGLLFSPALAGTMIVPLMLYHQLQMIACALLANRYGRQVMPDAAAKP